MSQKQEMLKTRRYWIAGLMIPAGIMLTGWRTDNRELLLTGVVLAGIVLVGFIVRNLFK